ncbi:hypothetical protein ASD04_14990 [Devosia sp. Root436]|uniref:phage head spike fiber domain-containing protein n=1 Tax=Devosia sp. Root436 TaxID=1736537 RepID=UPI0006FE8C2D|nr:carbohydrate binding domain-containing protein [Devosia sp. Root436]KQX35343.1 hypothetical protein ASD04_14990 [Devosia sp. Root436]
MLIGQGSGRNGDHYLFRPSGVPGDASMFIDFVNQRAWRGLVEPIAFDNAFSCDRGSAGYAPNAAGVLVPFAADEPRITDVGILIEPAATNLCLWSNDIANAAYVLTSGASKTSDVIAAPDGSMTGDMVTYGDGTLAFQMYQIIPVAEGTQYTYSYYARLGTKLRNRYAIYNNTAGAWIVTEAIATGVTSGAWTRVKVTFTTPAGCTGIRVYPDRFTANIDGPTGSTIYIWGQQLEAGPAASSPIETTSSTATRAADAITVALPSGTHDLILTFDDNSTQVLDDKSGDYLLPADLLNRRTIKTLKAIAA